MRLCITDDMLLDQVNQLSARCERQSQELSKLNKNYMKLKRENEKLRRLLDDQHASQQ
jgi:cell division protein FtsB